jgi:hypothetical protein
VITVKKGDHYSEIRFQPHCGLDSYRALVQFTPSCAYTLPMINQPSVNKLYGYTMGFRDSVRFGWKSESEKSDDIILCPYVHEAGEIVRPNGFLRVKIGQQYELTIVREGRTFIWAVDRKMIAAHQFKKNPWRFGVKQHLYFGGTHPAPHDVSLYLDYLPPLP